MISAETPYWEIERKSQIFNEDFYLPLYLPLWTIYTFFLIDFPDISEMGREGERARERKAINDH